jgi:hypothetical protein
MEIWNNRMGRWVNRGSKGIALIDDSGPRKSLRYVFDISDTHMVRGGKTPYIWQMESWVRPEMSDYLADTYGLETDPEAPLPTVLMSLARAQTEENLNDAMDGLSYEIQGTWLEELGQDAVREGFRRLMENSTYYMLARRCGLDPWEELTPDDFTGITNFNRLSVLSFLGNAAHDIAEPVLRDIGRELILRYRLRAADQKKLKYRKYPKQRTPGPLLFLFHRSSPFRTCRRLHSREGRSRNAWMLFLPVNPTFLRKSLMSFFAPAVIVHAASSVSSTTS